MLDFTLNHARRPIEAPAVRGTPFEQALERAEALAATWRARVLGSAGCPDPTSRWLAAVPDIGPTCEVLLADALFHDLSLRERTSLLDFVRGSQHEGGAWSSLDGVPDLSLTVLGWWARRCAGDDPQAPSMVRACRFVHARGGAQRANFSVRLWLVLSGALSWDVLPAIPGELFLLPSATWLSPARFSPWARAMLTAYYAIARGGGKLQLPDPSELLIRRYPAEPAPVAPRLTRPGLAGDLLQAFDRSVKLSRKLPRGPARRWALDRVYAEINRTQQPHGGWFSTRPTLLSLLALRVRGVTSTDDRITRGLAHLRASRGWTELQEGPAKGERVLAQGLGGTRLHTAAGLLRASHDAADLETLMGLELVHAGPWQDRVNAPAGGWSHEPGGSHHVDLEATCSVFSLLRGLGRDAPRRSAVWAARRRAIGLMLAMQEPGGGFARFERGESDVFMQRLPWTDADLLARGEATDAEHLELSGHALAQLSRAGFRIGDDRVARGLQWLAQNVDRVVHTRELAPACGVAQAAACLCPPTHPLRQRLEQHIRAQQREDGSFGSIVATARALHTLLQLSGPCVQSHRAARNLAETLGRSPTQATSSGFGLSPTLGDPSADARETTLALRAFAPHVAS